MMSGSGHSRRTVALRLLAVVAFAGTAALAVVLTRIPVPRSALSAARDYAACTSSVLAASIGSTASQDQDRAHWNVRGHYYLLRFTNISRRACSLYGYPDVSAYTGPLPAGSPATLDTSVRPRRVTLAPGASAQSVLVYHGTGGYQPAQCLQVVATALRIYLPRQVRAEQVPFGQPVCARRGPAVLSVQPIQPKAAISGFSGM